MIMEDDVLMETVIYEVIDGSVTKIYEDGETETLCLIEDIGSVIERTRETLDRMEEKLKPLVDIEDTVLNLMFSDYVRELNELKRISLLNS